MVIYSLDMCLMNNYRSRDRIIIIRLDFYDVTESKTVAL